VRAGKDISPDEDLTLQQLIEEGILQHWPAVEEVCTIAEKEHALDKALDNMMNEWKGVDFDILPYKETGTYVVKAVDDIMMMLDDQIVKSQTMMGSPFIKPIAEKCRGWERKLVRLLDLFLSSRVLSLSPHLPSFLLSRRASFARSSLSPHARVGVACRCRHRVCLRPAGVHAEAAGRVDPRAAHVAVPRADLRQRGHHAADAARGSALLQR
jgi:hypothetical protein